MKTKLLASSATLEGVRCLVSKFYCGSTITLNAVDDRQWSISNAIRTLEGVRVVFAKGRYRFESISEG